MNPYKLVQIKDYWWPADVGEQYTYSLKRVESMHRAIKWCKEAKHTDVVVQAGGSIGVWPKVLSEHFKHVYTFEPEPISFYCLCRNVLGENVTKIQAALGDRHECVDIKKIKLTSHYLNGLGYIPQFLIDDLGLKTCDAILLDVEGSEKLALLGAFETIALTHPLILVESRGPHSRELEGSKDIDMFLKNLGYCKLDSVGMDDIYVHQP